MATHIPTRIGPKVGRKQVFLPNFVLTLLRTPTHPPNFASFIVPLNLNKLDLRDYLWHAYGISVRGVRSYIQQQKVHEDKPGALRPSPRRWFRPRAIKKMMVEMETPFVWPAVPEKLDDWDKSTFDAVQKEREAQQAEFKWDARQSPSGEREIIAEQAKALLQEKESWSQASKAQWVNDGEAVEVEQDIEVPPVLQR